MSKTIHKQVPIRNDGKASQAVVRFVFLGVLLFVSACSPFKVEERKRFFWPPPPGDPKIEFIEAFYIDHDLLRGVDTRLKDAILGRALPVRLFVQPYSLAVATLKKRLYVVDYAESGLSVLDFAEHKEKLLKLSAITRPQKVTIDSVGDIWILDGIAPIVEHLDSDEKFIEKFELTGMGRPTSLAVDRQRGRIYIVDTQNHKIQVLTLAGEVVNVFGRRGRGEGEFNFPTDLDLDQSGNLYIVDSLNCRIQILDPDGRFVRAFGERGTEAGSFSIPKGITVDNEGHVFVTDAGNHKLVIFDSTGNFLLRVGGEQQIVEHKLAPGGMLFPAGIDIDPQGRLWLADLMNGVVFRYQILTQDYLLREPILSRQLYSPHKEDLSQEDTVKTTSESEIKGPKVKKAIRGQE